MRSASKILLLLAFILGNAAAFAPRSRPSLQVFHQPIETQRAATVSLAAKQPKGTEEPANAPSIIDIIKKKPATLVMAPFVVIVGLDLLLNMVFLTKRTFEYFVLGKMPSTEVWFSDNLFM